MTQHGNLNSRNLPPELALLTSLAQQSLLAEAMRAGEMRPASHHDVARHEAGHVLGSALLGAGTRHCWVRRVDGAWIGYTEPRELPAWSIPVNDGRRALTPHGGVARAVFCFAGPTAERGKGGGGGLANLAGDLPEMMQAMEAFRVPVVMAGFPDRPPSDDEEVERVGRAHMRMWARLVGWLTDAVHREAPCIDAIAAKLVTHGRLASHEIEPLVRGVTRISTGGLFDHLRQGLPIGPLPEAIPAAYLDELRERSPGSDME